jgi:NAD(P)-dependent dehydrogenase (short-subunit alcohol dehydrogenase family)
MVAKTIEAFGGIDILVNNAGWRPIPQGNAYDDIANDFQTAAQWERVFKVNVFSLLICSRAVRESMASRGGGVVICQTSMAAYNKPYGAYGVSKIACSGVTTHLATELAPDNIRVNGIAPGVMTQRMSDEQVQGVLDMQMIKRKGTPQDLAGALLYLTSDMSSFVTGVNLLVDGGVTRQV